MSIYYTPGLGAMEKTVSIPVIQQFTVTVGGGRRLWKGPADTNPANTEAQGKLRTLLCFNLITILWAWKERAIGAQSHSQSLSFSIQVKMPSSVGALWLFPASYLPALLRVITVLAGLVSLMLGPQHAVSTTLKELCQLNGPLALFWLDAVRKTAA